MGHNLTCIVLLYLALVQASSVVKRQITATSSPSTAGLEDPFEPSEFGDGGVTYPPQRLPGNTIPLATSGSRHGSNAASVPAPNLLLEDPTEPAEFGDRGMTYQSPVSVRARQAALLRRLSTLPNYRSLMAAYERWRVAVMARALQNGGSTASAPSLSVKAVKQTNSRSGTAGNGSRDQTGSVVESSSNSLAAASSQNVEVNSQRLAQNSQRVIPERRTEVLISEQRTTNSAPVMVKQSLVTDGRQSALSDSIVAPIVPVSSNTPGASSASGNPGPVSINRPPVQSLPRDYISQPALLKSAASKSQAVEININSNSSPPRESNTAYANADPRQIKSSIPLSPVTKKPRNPPEIARIFAAFKAKLLSGAKPSSRVKVRSKGRVESATSQSAALNPQSTDVQSGGSPVNLPPALGPINGAPSVSQTAVSPDSVDIRPSEPANLPTESNFTSTAADGTAQETLIPVAPTVELIPRKTSNPQADLHLQNRNSSGQSQTASADGQTVAVNPSDPSTNPLAPPANAPPEILPKATEERPKKSSVLVIDRRITPTTI